MAVSEKECYDESETDPEYSDYSQEDPNFDVLEETRLTLSNLSLKRKSNRLQTKGTDEKEKEGELDEQDQKSYETIQKIIEGGQMDRLKVEECKLYLRKHGLRLSGNKETLIQRINEHINIVNGGGEKKYPASSFVLNCKGDACTGDVVMFEQNVYEEFNIASRSAKDGPCGTRVVAGRILKESYGAAKQQHTFTIEVLWSKGEKPLPPLHPLLIKGRNLYRLKTMRQKWEDEGERRKILLEKHARGGAARLTREARMQQREMRKLQKQDRATQNEHLNEKQEEENKEPLYSVHVKPDKLINQPKLQQQQQKVHCYTKTRESNFPIQPVNLHGKPNDTSNAHALPVHQRQPLINQPKLQQQKQKFLCCATTCEPNIPIQPVNLLGKLNDSNAHVLPVHQGQPLSSMNCSFQKDHHTGSRFVNFYSSKSPIRESFEDQNEKYCTVRSSIRGRPLSIFSNSDHFKIAVQRHALKENQGCSSMRRPLCRFGPENVLLYSQQSRVQNLNAARNPPVEQQKGNEQKQKCRYFVQGRCCFGDRCKYLHELA